MKRSLNIVLVVLLILTGCTKVEKTRKSGIDTIDNITYMSTTYYVYGFSFSLAKLVSTTPAPYPDIVLLVNTDDPVSRLTIQAVNLNNSFFKFGDYPDAASAMSAFNSLKTVEVTQWEGMADPISANQVWIYRSGTDTYTKVRIINTVNEIRQTIPYGECTFEWVYQSDGSLTFP